VKLHIDEERCQGHGRCWDVAPALIECDDTGRGIVVAGDVPDSLLDAARTAVNACPEMAVTLDQS
jgi:ferredoxin